MTELNYKEACYAFMVAVANEDSNVTSTERYVIEHFFDDKFNLFRLSDKKKKEIGSDLRTSMPKEKYTELFLTALKKEKKEKQMQAYELVCKFINTNCPKNSSAWAVACDVQKQLGFSMDEFKEFEVWQAKK